MMPTTSPGATPAATKPLARASTSAAKVAAVTSVQPPGALTEKVTLPGSARAWRPGRSARLPSVVAGRTRGVAVSCTVELLWVPGGAAPQL